MKVVTIAGTRPEWVRLSRIIPLLDNLLGTGHLLVHTGQNADPNLDTVFFEEFGLRTPDLRFESGGVSFARQMAISMLALEEFLGDHKPDRILVLGDTNSSLAAAIASARLSVTVYHLEAGNRCHGPESPEEINRRIVDHVSTVHLCYTERARMNLVAEGIPLARTFVVGNPLAEVLAAQPIPLLPEIRALKADLGLPDGDFLLASLHRAENVDDPERLYRFLDSIESACRGLELPCLLTLHPRTRDRLGDGPWLWPSIVPTKPLPYGQFVNLQRACRVLLSDSGTAPESCCMLHKPLVILRDYCERQELLERGVGVLWTDRSPISLLKALEVAMVHGQAPVPEEYQARPTAKTVAQLLLSPVPPY